MRFLLLLTTISIVGCGVIPEFNTSVEMQSERAMKLLLEGERVLLNCTGSVTWKQASKFNQSFYFHLKIMDLRTNQMLNTSKVVYKNDMPLIHHQWVSIYVSHQFYTPSRDYMCALESNFTGFTTKKATTSFVFKNPPRVPTNISYAIVSNNLYVFADSPYNELVRTTLDTKYAMSVRGNNCSHGSIEEWSLMETCTVSQMDMENTVICVVKEAKKLEKCSIVSIIIIIDQDGAAGLAVSQMFNIRNVKETEAFASVETIYNSSNQILVKLLDNTKLTKFHGISYKVKYWTKESTSEKKEIASTSRLIPVKDLFPNTCYYISAKFEASIYSTEDKIIANWTTPQLECTKVKAITDHPRNFTCQQVARPTGGSPAMLKLTWESPNIDTKIYGKIKSYKLSTVILLPHIRTNITLNATVAMSKEDDYQLYSNYDEYKFGRYVYYELSACNDVGCSDVFSRCSLKLSDPLPSVHKRIPLSILLSCLIPSITIVMLIIGAFISYYTKKEIAKDLEEPLTVTGKTNDAAEGNSSQESDVDGTSSGNNNNSVNKSVKKSNPRLPPQLTEEGNGRPDSYADDNITSANNKDKTLFVNATLNEREREMNRQRELQRELERERLLQKGSRSATNSPLKV
ncbi:uncharacterized protein LOC130628575 [Hydractinia symbiolongicarpus]|uniref:uncharacterized protein LOC130628575 n=1 Tax=Hydractinia symbiolongicarpus TaxID=13093 RepID=UPI00254E3C7B|nr:uncharacterized protein LOC130628575 [Hydractinia symbiolongicarpus]XP_057297510.1 uncharacterized protein LOC130628575 [Hydractinia symbiolongicarpus]XP_057297511.1 uncharacterized protein LOC130628575 [Hydractinia symbiolongicarpus]XP_057297512.1 uncharacterized protein LOC130628575 [Hydractinia symbiolongicarpus]